MTTPLVCITVGGTKLVVETDGCGGYFVRAAATATIEATDTVRVGLYDLYGTEELRDAVVAMLAELDKGSKMRRDRLNPLIAAVRVALDELKLAPNGGADVVVGPPEEFSW